MCYVLTICTLQHLCATLHVMFLQEGQCVTFLLKLNKYKLFITL